MSVKVYSVIVLCLCLMGISCKDSGNQSGTQAQANIGVAQTNPSPATDSGNTAQANVSMPATNAPAKGVIDGCALLTADELKAVQGEAPKETKSSTRPNSAFAISQCFYTMPTFNKSVSLEVTRNNPDNPSANVRQFWKERFEEPAEKREQEEREREKERKRERGEGEEEEEVKLTKVTGVGEEAFWGGDARAGVLYVMKKDSILRLSIGGPDSVNIKIQKLKTLAQKALKRLS
ncbi:MAG: hypothetical protein ICV60_04240 [Pyrinomonadaceae bacterium]|nr:hypothetical protein [Pyrinomonadaceae bacterium]